MNARQTRIPRSPALGRYALASILLTVSARTYRNASGARSLRRLIAAVCLFASLAILAHHSIPPTDMHGMSSAMETCVAVAGHATHGLAVPVALVAALLGASFLMRLVPLPVLARPRVTRARAGPSELRISLRC